MPSGADVDCRRYHLITIIIAIIIATFIITSSLSSTLSSSSLHDSDVPMWPWFLSTLGNHALDASWGALFPAVAQLPTGVTSTHTEAVAHTHIRTHTHTLTHTH